MHEGDFTKNNKESMIKRLNLGGSYSVDKTNKLNNIIPKAIEYLRNKNRGQDYSSMICLKRVAFLMAFIYRKMNQFTFTNSTQFKLELYSCS